MSEPTEPEVGKVYRVTLEDCCIGGEFQSRLTFRDEDGMVFENGVTLHEWNGCEFEELRLG